MKLIWRKWLTGALIARIVILGITASTVIASQLPPFEPNPEFRASQILPPQSLRGPHHTVQERVTNDGFLNHYVVQTPFGSYGAEGNLQLRRAIIEARALAELDEVSHSELFVDAAARTVAAPVEAIDQFLDAPSETVKGIPGGLSRKFKSLSRKAKAGAEEVKEASKDEDGDWKEEGKEATATYARKWFGVTGAERRWAEKLGVDPYSSNAILREKLKAVARVDAAATMGAKLAMPGLGGLSYVVTVSNLVWSMDGESLREHNLQQLAGAGISRDLIDDFLDHPYFSPTQQTFIVAALLEIRHVNGVDRILRLPDWVDTDTEAWFYTEAVQLMARYHKTVRPLSAIVGERLLPAMVTDRNQLVYVLPLDYMTWNEILLDLVESIANPSSGKPASRELLLSGTTTQTARNALAVKGWSVKTGITIQ